MWNLKSVNLLLFLWLSCLTFGSVIGAEDTLDRSYLECGALGEDYEEEPFSKRMIVHKAIDGCLDTVYQIRSGELSQEEGLEKLQYTLDFVQFMCWYWVED